MAFKRFALSALLATSALAKTDLGGCETTDLVVTVTGRNENTVYTTHLYYLPDTGEICEILDCGGGRAPPKTTVPGCGAYKGTETYSPRFLPTSTADPAPEETDPANNTGADEDTTDAPTGSAPTTSGTQTTGAPDASTSGPATTGGSGDSGAAAMGVSLFGGLLAAGAAGAALMF